MPKSSNNFESIILDTLANEDDSINEQMDSAETLTGIVLKNRFELLESIGAGGMGSVYKALDRRDLEVGNSRFIAIKVLHVEAEDDTTLLKALHSETRKTQNLAHPNIIRVYDFDRDDCHVFMTMEYMEGVALDKIIGGNPSGLTAGKALLLINQLVQALQYAHAQGLVHSDLKPANVLVTINNHLKVLDFGISRLLDFNRTNEFDAGVICAYTPAYSTLEMINNGSPDPKDDVYSLACICYELFTGQHPFNRLSAERAMEQGLEPEANEVFSSLQYQTIKQALNFDRELRLSTVDQFLQGMQATKKKSKKRIIVLILAALFAIVLLASWFVTRNNIHPVDQTEIDSGLAIENTNPVKSSETQDLILLNVNKLDLQETPLELQLELNQTLFKLGETLRITFKVNQPAYVRIILINSLGELVHLFPNPFQKKYYCQPNIIFHIPPIDAQFKLDIRPPAGQDKIIAISSPVPFSKKFLQIDDKGELLRNSMPKSFVFMEKTFEIVESQ